MASVTRRGLPWQVSVLKLFVRGFLPTNNDLVRQAFHELLTEDLAETGGSISCPLGVRCVGSRLPASTFLG